MRKYLVRYFIVLKLRFIIGISTLQHVDNQNVVRLQFIDVYVIIILFVQYTVGLSLQNSLGVQILVCSEFIGGSHTILYKSNRHVSGYFIHSFQARAMTRNKESRFQSL